MYGNVVLQKSPFPYSLTIGKCRGVSTFLFTPILKYTQQPNGHFLKIDCAVDGE